MLIISILSLSSSLNDDMVFRVLYASNEKDYKDWLAIWNAWEENECFAHPEYLLLYKDQAEALCAVLEDGNQKVIFPFSLRSVPTKVLGTNYYDIITPYGYGDIYFVNCSDLGVFYREFCKRFHAWANVSNIVSEFIRFDLFSKSLNFYKGELSFINENIVCDLSKGEQQVIDAFQAKVRRNIRKALCSGLQISFDSNGGQVKYFYDLYKLTMDRLKADPKYYLKPSYFEQLNKRMKGQYLYAYAYKDDIPLASILILMSAKNMYYFLGGADASYFSFRPNELLHFEVMKWGIRNDKSKYVLGGGYKFEDSLFAFKKSFSPNGIERFYCGKHIYNTEVYNSLVLTQGKKDRELGEKNKDNGFFPAYRRPNRESII